jgi:hypothetical protein
MGWNKTSAQADGSHQGTATETRWWERHPLLLSKACGHGCSPASHIGEQKQIRGWRICVPCLAEISQVINEVDSFLIIDSDDDTTLVTKLIFMCLRDGYRSCHACIGTQERVEILVRAEHRTYQTNTHHENRGKREKNSVKVAWDHNRVQQGVVLGVGGVETD